MLASGVGAQFKLVKYVIGGQEQWLPVHRTCNPLLKAERARYKAQVENYKSLLAQKQDLEEKFLAQSRQLGQMQEQIERYVERLADKADYAEVKADRDHLLQERLTEVVGGETWRELEQTKADLADARRQLDQMNARMVGLATFQDEYNRLAEKHGDFIVVLEQLDQAQKNLDYWMNLSTTQAEELKQLIEANRLYEETQARLEHDWLAEKERREQLEHETQRLTQQLARHKALFASMMEE
jgi:DNA repair exonuclease SbcCD ATPase subunit